MTWELVDIHGGVDEERRGFMPRYAFWDTVTSKFVEIAGEMGWDGYGDLLSYKDEDPVAVGRALSLLPETERDAEGADDGQ